MITVKKARRLLRKEVKNKSDKEVQEILNSLYALAEALIESSSKNGSNKYH